MISLRAHRPASWPRRAFSLAAAALFALTLLAAAADSALAAQESSGRLTVTGRAEIKVEPDMAVFTVGVETRAETVQEARQLNAEAMERVRGALLAEGADSKDLKTKGFTVQPEWQYNPEDGSRTLLGYRVVHTLEVTVRQLDDLGRWLDAAMENGANQVSSPVFGISRPEELEDQALAQATLRARAKADVLARASGVFLKRVVQVTEQVTAPTVRGSSVMMMTAETAARSATEISPGEVSVTATVSITYEI